MKRISMFILTILALALLVCVDGRTHQVKSQNSPAVSQIPTVNQIKVTARTVTGLPANKKYIVDLSSKGAIYEFNPAAGQIDYNRITILTVVGEEAIGQALSKATLTRWASQGFRIGATADFRRVWGPQKPPLQNAPSGPVNYTCVGKYCDCTGALDCGNMILSGKCGHWVACTTKGQCICEAKK